MTVQKAAKKPRAKSQTRWSRHRGQIAAVLGVLVVGALVYFAVAHSSANVKTTGGATGVKLSLKEVLRAHAQYPDSRPTHAVAYGNGTTVDELLVEWTAFLGAAESAPVLARSPMRRGNAVETVAIVLSRSGADGVARRAFLRAQYAALYNWAVVFLVAGPRTELLCEKSPDNRCDVWAVRSPDDYNWLSHRIRFLLAALPLTPVQYDFMLKTDDDALLCPARLSRVLDERLTAMSAVRNASRGTYPFRLYGGSLLVGYQMTTDPKHKWNDPDYLDVLRGYSTMLPFMGGGGYLLSWDLVQTVGTLIHAGILQPMRNEDLMVGTYIVGLEKFFVDYNVDQGCHCAAVKSRLRARSGGPAVLGASRSPEDLTQSIESRWSRHHNSAELVMNNRTVVHHRCSLDQLVKCRVILAGRFC